MITSALSTYCYPQSIDIEKLITLRGHVDTINYAALSSNQKYVITASKDGTACIWEAATGKKCVQLQNCTSILYANFSTDCTKAITISIDKVICVWNTFSGQELFRIKSDEKYGTVSAHLSPDGKKIALSNMILAGIWDIPTNRFHLKLDHVLVDTTHFSKDGNKLLTTDWIGQAFLWNSQTGKRLAELKGFNDDISAVCFSNHGKFIATGSSNKALRLWDVSEGQLIHSLSGHKKPIFSVAFSPKDTWLATSSQDQTLKIWRVADGKEIYSTVPSEYFLGQVSFSADSKSIIIISLKDKCCRCITIPWASENHLARL